MSIAALRRNRRLSPEFHTWLRLVMPPSGQPPHTRDRHVERQRQYNSRHRRVINAKARLYHVNHRAEIRERQADYYKRNKARLIEKQRAYYAAHRAEQIRKAVERKRARRNTQKGAVSVVKVRRGWTPTAIELLRKPARTGPPSRSSCGGGA